MTGIEQFTGRAAAKAGGRLLGAAHRHLLKKKVRRDSRTLVAREVADRFLGSLDGERAERLRRYLGSPDFEEVALQLTLWRLLRDEKAAELRPTLREEVRLGLHHAVGLDPEQLTIGADVVLDSLVVAVQEECRGLDAGAVDEVTAAGVAHLSASAAANTELLGRVESLAAFHSFGERLRKQVAEDHAVIRMPHLGLHRSVPYGQLYVEPSLDGADDLLAPGRRTVVLGDPGAGKSTLAAKLAHDVAVAEDGRVPFLLVLRNFTTSFRHGGEGLAWYLGKGCQEPYNVTPPDDAVEYLLGNGRAVVVLDGVDELMEPELRQRFARLVESFTRLYPLVPVVVTARKIGYDDAPLDPGLFTTAIVEPFDEERVERYARNWFALSESVPERERTGLAEAFLRESESIDDLRSNPLLLALLCNMFAYEHYIPGNLAQVYEKCSLMLFEQWDHRRGMREMPRFHGRLRSAVGYLAWQQFTAESSGEGWPRRQVVRMLSGFLEEKEYRPDEAEEEATRFVDFCAGRPWVLTDIGGGATEPRYGFAHRTFLEYFAAEYLVRNNPTPEALWEAVRPFASGISLVPFIALQLFDEHREDGASEVLKLVIAQERLRFAAEALRYVAITPGVLRSLAEAMVRGLAGVPVEGLFFHLYSRTRTAYDLYLRMALNSGLPANQAIVRETASALLWELALQGDQCASELLARFRLAVPPGAPLTEFLRSGDPDPSGAIRALGPVAAYLHEGDDTALITLAHVDWSRVDPALFTEAPLPWVAVGDWELPFPEEGEAVPFAPLWGARGAELLLQLPDLETYEHHPTAYDTTDAPPLAFELVGGRNSDEERRKALATLREMGAQDQVIDFLDRWMRREFDVIG